MAAQKTVDWDCWWGLIIVGMTWGMASPGMTQTIPFAPLPLEAVQQEVPPVTEIAPYILGPGDQVAVVVLGYDEFTGSRVILPDGTLSIPLVGSIQAAGRTTDDLSAELTHRLREYLINPVVNINLTVLRPVVVNVAGDVYRPGPVQLSSLTQADTRLDTSARITSTTNTPTLASALTAAGGIRRTADIRQITVQRRLPDQQVEVIHINLWDALTLQASIENPLVLRDGDYVYVPQATEALPEEQRIVATSSFAPATVRVRVIGEVQRPGEVEVSPDGTVSSAVAISGGPTDDAQLNAVALVRLNDQGQVEERILDLTNLVDQEQVQDGDVVLVPKRGYLTPLDTLGRVANTILAPLRILEIFRLIRN